MLQQLPEDVEVIRASGNTVCKVCGKLLREHEMFLYPGADYGPIKSCDGVYYHL